MKNKQGVVVCIFAHPDDESFGPGGTIATFARTHDVYILCATRGEAGTHHDPNKLQRIAQIRSQELRNSATILGVKKIYFLGFQDGTLNNNLYHKLASKIETHLKKIKPEILITFEPRGISGHIDHIVVSLVTSYVFNKFSFIKKLMYYCITETQRKRIGAYFIYFPPGYRKRDISASIDVREVWSQKIQAMYCHDSQKNDIKRVLDQRKGLLKEEHFLVMKK